VKKIIEIPIAEPSKRKGKSWRWNWKVPGWETYRKNYKSDQHGQFFVKNSNLYVREVNMDYLNALIDAGIRVAGSGYALALELADGDRHGKTFRMYLSYFDKRAYRKYSVAVEHMKILENYIKTRAIACGVQEDGRINWMPQHVVLDFNVKTLQDYFSKDKSRFMVVDRVLYYLRTRREIVEALFWKCLEIAGNEYALAIATSGGKRTLFYMHKKAYERLSFSHGKTISYYIKIFEKYLAKHPQLFDAKVAL